MLPNRSKAGKDRNIEMIERHLAGDTIDELAAAYGLSRSTVYHIVVRIKRSSGSGEYPVIPKTPR